MASIVNIAAYKFVELDNLLERRAALKELTASLRLKGTILLSHEGINMFVAGERESIDTFLAYIRSSSPNLNDLAVKESLTDYQPFNRMLVRLKREIIPVGHDGKLEVETTRGRYVVTPSEVDSPKLPPQELRRWLDEGREVTLIDTRNTYEVELGTFRGALDLNLRTFRDFPAAAANLSEEIKKKPAVMFCTGGIRCEKIGPFMKGLGFENLYQLEGGILKYFEECEQSHYDGDCFVFDQRVSVNARLNESNSFECFACKGVLKEVETHDPRYVPGRSCPHCYDRQEHSRLDRQKKAIEIATEQRGSTPYELKRWVSIPQSVAGLSLIDALVSAIPGYGRDNWLGAITRRELVSPRDESQVLNPDQIVNEGERFLHKMPNYVEPKIATDFSILFEDEAVVVINKSAPLPVHPSGRYFRNSLSEILNQTYAPEKIRPCHRLDAHTTGVCVFSRRFKHANSIQEQFSQGTVHKSYRLVVHGIVPWSEHRCSLPISKEVLPCGGRKIDSSGQEAITLFRVLEMDAVSNTTVLEAIPLTGRTHQIRLHAAALGFPIVGDPIYLEGGNCKAKENEEEPMKKMELHSWKIEIEHPVTRERIQWIAPPPTLRP